MNYDELVDFLIKCSLEYERGEELITDKEYDVRYRALQEMEKDPSNCRKDSPTKLIPTLGKRTTHPSPMYSMRDAFTTEEVKKWLEVVAALIYIIMPKFDGISLNLIYRRGRLVKAITRGDGKAGENVTIKAKYIRGVIQKIPYTGDLEIRGEVTISREDFNTLNATGYSFKNARNAVSGTMGLKDINEFKKRLLTFMPWGASLGLETHEQVLLELFSYGFKCYEYRTVSTLKEIEDYFLSLDDKQDSFKVDLDGLAIRVNDNVEYEDLGVANKYPKGILAYKFSTEEKVTTLLKVINQLGRTGVQTPVAVIEPVELSNARVNRATLHNWNNVSDLGLTKGCKVLVTRSGGVIPKIITVIEDGGDPILKPVKCDYCNHKLNETDSGLICRNKECDGIKVMQIISFASREKMDITGLGDSIISELFKHKVIRSPIDLYSLDGDDLNGLLGEKTISSILSAIDESKGRDIVTVLSTLPIPHVGKTYWKKIVDANLDIHSLSYSELIKLHGLGRTIISNILTYMSENEHYVWNLLRTTEAVVPTKGDDKYKGRVFYLTGTLDKPRKVYVDLITSNGGKVISTINKTITDFLIGKNAVVAKLVKAEELGLNIIKELE